MLSDKLDHECLKPQVLLGLRSRSALTLLLVRKELCTSSRGFQYYVCAAAWHYQTVHPAGGFQRCPFFWAEIKGLYAFA
jgi:hypothetical protein